MAHDSANRQSGRPSIQSIPTCKATGGCSAGAPSRHGAAVLVGWWQAMVLAASATANRYSTPPGHRSGSGGAQDRVAVKDGTAARVARRRERPAMAAGARVCRAERQLLAYSPLWSASAIAWLAKKFDF